MIKSNNLNIESLLKRLEEISNSINNNESLDESIALYNEAKEIISQCNEYLSNLKKNKEIIEEIN